MSDPLPSHRLFDGPHLRATVFGTGPGLFATFDNFVRGKAGFDECRPSAKVLKAGYRHVMIQTARNSWYLGDDLAPLQAALAALPLEGPSRSLGFSMGGYGAILLASALRSEEVVLVSPRFPQPMGWAGRARVNADPAVLPRGWQDQLTAAAKCLRARVLYDPQHHDDRQTLRWLQAQSRSITALSLAFGGHPCTRYLVADNQFGALQDRFLAPEIRLASIRPLIRAARPGSTAYQEALTRYLALRRQR